MPLQRRPFLSLRPRQARPPAAADAGVAAADGSRRGPSLAGPPGQHGLRTLRSLNEKALTDNIRIVTTFLDPPTERRRGGLLRGASSSAGAGALADVDDGGREDAGSRASVAESAGSHTSGGGATPRAAAALLGRKESGGGGRLYPKSSVVSSRVASSRSLPPLVAPTTPGRARGAGWPPRVPARPRALPLGPGGPQASASAERTRQIMTALCCDAYRGIPQVKRQALLATSGAPRAQGLLRRRAAAREARQEGLPRSRRCRGGRRGTNRQRGGRRI